MSFLTQKFETKSNAESKINWDVSLGWHEVRIVGVCYLGQEKNKYSDKLQDKISICFATDETVDVYGEIRPKTKVEKFTGSLFESANLVKNVLTPAGISATSFDELIGRTLRIKYVERISEGVRYINIGNADESENPIDCPKDLYVPKFWIVNDGVTKSAKEIAKTILVEDGVIVSIQPTREAPVATIATVAPIADADAIVIPDMTETEDEPYEDMYA